MLSPRAGEEVGDAGVVEGTVSVPEGCHLWLLVHRKDIDGWWPQGDGPVHVEGTRWKVIVRYGDPPDSGHDFEIAAVVVGLPTHELWTDWVAQAQRAGLVPPTMLPRPNFILGDAYRTVRKTGYQV
jgi:hypothetical protein